MTAREVIDVAVALLRADDIEQILSEPDPSANAEVKSLAHCVTLAVAETCGDGFPIVKSERLVSSGGVIPLSVFSAVPASIEEVRSGGRTVSFRVDGMGVYVNGDGEYVVKYSVEPPACGLADTIECGALVDKYMLAYLTARNYCLVTGRTDDAAIWDQRYCAEAEKKRLGRRAKLPMYASFI